MYISIIEMMINFPDQNQFPKITTNRLKLRSFEFTDNELIYDFNADLEMLRYVPLEILSDKQQAVDRFNSFKEHYEQKKAIWWVIEENSTQQPMGYCGLFSMDPKPKSAEIGYGLLKPFWGLGVATEIVAELVKYSVKSLDLHRIQAFVTPGNPGSTKVLEKNGFKLEGHLKDIDFARDQYFDRLVYAYINNSHPI